MRNGKTCDRHALRTAVNRVARERVNFFDQIVGHREAADADALPVDHDEIAGAAERAVERVRIADVEREMIFAVGL